MSEPCKGAKALATAITGYLVDGITTTGAFGPTGEWGRADKYLAEKIQAVIDKAVDTTRGID